MKTLSLCAALAAIAAPLHAQTIDDGIMMTAKSIQTGYVYTHDSWDQYWEGTLKRTNGNIGTITTESSAWAILYGVNNRLTLVGSVPFVSTSPSQGVLQGQHGMQDLTIGGKYSFLERSSPKYGALRAIAGLSGSFPMSSYTPDFAPLSIGTQSQRISPRLTLNYQMDKGVYLNATTAYTRRADVTLDRPYFFTDDVLTLSSEVPMSDVVDWTASLGYLKHDLNTYIGYTQHTTRGGGDIRRQDMPFVNNRVTYSQLSAMAMYPIPKINAVAFQFAVAHILDGRNVGQSTTFTFALLYSRAHRGRLIR